MDKDPFRIRDLGGAFEVGSEADGPIVQMFKYNNKLIVLKTKAIYEIVEADQVDPERKNPNLPPNIQRRLMPLGSESELVSRTLLIARRLFDKDRLHPSIDVNRALELAFEAMIEMNAMQTTFTELEEAVSSVCNEYERQAIKNVSYSIPSVNDIGTRCKTFFQKADHVTQAAMEIITLLDMLHR